MKAATFLAYCLTIPAANWLIGNVGVQFDSHGPHLIPVGFGLMAPSGVLMIGLALVLRDVVQWQSGKAVALAAIAVGGVLSGLVAPAPLVIASVAAFLLSELLDMAVYTPLAQRNLPVAVGASAAAGALADSAVFLLIAFGSLDHLAGQVVGKLWMALAAMPILYYVRRVRA